MEVIDINKTILKLTIDEICNILNVKKDTLRKLKNNGTIYNRLLEKGYSLQEIKKEDKELLYIVEELNKNVTIYSNVLEYVFKAKDKDKFSKYFLLRTSESNNIYNKKDIAIKTDTSTRTVMRWDKRMVDNNIITKDGFYYFYVDKLLKKIIQCDIYEYKNYWKNVYTVLGVEKAKEQRDNEEISTDQLLTIHKDAIEAAKFISDKYYFRINKYITNKDNQLYKDICDLINNIYLNDDMIEGEI